MPGRIQLKDPGSELVMKVSSVSPEVVEKNSYFLFGNGAKELLVPQSSVTGQIARLDATSVENLIGKVIKFSRSLKMSRASKPFWNLDLATPEEIAAMPQGAAAPASAAVPATGNAAGAAGAPATAKKSYTDIYVKATDFIIEKIVPKYKAAGLTLSGTDVKEMVACVFIPKSKE